MAEKGMLAMKTKLLLHAASLALVGWYLMAPPWYNDEKEPRLHAPIADWEIIGSFDSADQCMHDLVEMANKARARSTPKERREFGIKCIASDDPRLKEK
jgi:hypothetical protein